MAGEQNFRLKVKQDNSYIDLFPLTTKSQIEGQTQWLETEVIEVTIPKYQGSKQIIQLSADGVEYMASNQFEIYLVSGSQSDYDSISQAEIVVGDGGKPTNLVLTRLYTYPLADIKVSIVFFKKG